MPTQRGTRPPAEQQLLSLLHAQTASKQKVSEATKFATFEAAKKRYETRQFADIDIGTFVYLSLHCTVHQIRDLAKCPSAVKEIDVSQVTNTTKFRSHWTKVYLRIASENEHWAALFVSEVAPYLLALSPPKSVTIPPTDDANKSVGRVPPVGIILGEVADEDVSTLPTEDADENATTLPSEDSDESDGVDELSQPTSQTVTESQPSEGRQHRIKRRRTDDSEFQHLVGDDRPELQDGVQDVATHPEEGMFDSLFPGQNLLQDRDNLLNFDIFQRWETGEDVPTPDWTGGPS